MATVSVGAWRRRGLFAAASLCLAWSANASAQALSPSTIDGTTVPKYSSMLAIPAQMPSSTVQPCAGAGCPAADYNIAERQFKQQILPAGFPATTVWSYGRDEDPIPLDPAAASVSTTSFFYPALTVENLSGRGTKVRWLNELVAIDPATGRPYPSGDPRRTFLPHITPVDPTLHWANPSKYPCLPFNGAVKSSGTDCSPDPATLPAFKEYTFGPTRIAPYAGPVPMVVHVHGAEDEAHSDGYAEAWFLPDASDVSAAHFALRGTQYDQYDRTNAVPGSAFFQYPNTQPPANIWFHDHSLGITRNNVYAGPAGFWMIRANPGSTNPLYSKQPAPGVLPGSGSLCGRPTNPKISYDAATHCGDESVTKQVANVGCDPNADPVCRSKIREIPLVLQDRGFYADGSLFYPASRDYANPVQLDANGSPVTTVQYKPDTDISPIVNPETFPDMIVVNGRVWPKLQVAAQRYRFRILNGADARTFDLELRALTPAQIAAAMAAGGYASGNDLPNEAFRGGLAATPKGAVVFPSGAQLPIYQIGAEQGFLPKVVKIKTGSMIELPPGAATELEPSPCVTQKFNLKGVQVRAPSNPQDPLCERGLLIGNAERADVLVSFSAQVPGTVVRMINLADDVPFNGFPLPDHAAYGPTHGGTDQVMQFEVVANFGADASGRVIMPPTDRSLPIARLDLTGVAEAPLAAPASSTSPHTLSLVENESSDMCASFDPSGFVSGIAVLSKGAANDASCSTALANGVPYGPRITLLGQMVGANPVSYMWEDAVTQAPQQNLVQEWDLYNFTPDAHPMHVHGVRFQVVERAGLQIDPNTGKAAIPAVVTGPAYASLATERGYKDSIVAWPGQRTRIRAKFERSGLYAWHCHIVEHEDNEMMLPMCIVPAGQPLPAACSVGSPDQVGAALPGPAPVPVSPAAY
jgi:spore coat protein A, manganese oxidase